MLIPFVFLTPKINALERTYSLDQIDEVAQSIVALIKENVITLTGENGSR